MLHRGNIVLALATTILLFAILLLLLADRYSFGLDIRRALMTLAGVTTVATLAEARRIGGDRSLSIHKYPYDEYTDRISFNEDHFRVVLIGQSERAKNSGEETQPWDLTMSQIVGLDNSLALAKLRMDIERELRRIAYVHETDVSARPLGITGIASELASRELVPSAWLSALKEIASVCNKAVHRANVPDEVTISVVRLGSILLERLRSIERDIPD